MKITVLMCVYNSEKFIIETINSILNQTFIDFEFIIIANCCTDNSVKLINDFSDHRIRLYETNISQLTFNLNYGLLLSKGEYIARIDSDDVANPIRLQKQIEFIEKFGYDVVGSNIDLIDENNELIKHLSFPESNKSIRKGILYRSILAHPTLMIKKDLLLSVSGYLGGKYAQDYDLYLRLMRDKTVKFYNIQEPLVKYRIHPKQSKGNKRSYAEVAGYFLKESIYSNNILFVFSSIIYYLKSIVR